jgi:hypothetical protein
LFLLLIECGPGSKLQAVAYGTHAGRYKTVKQSAICPPSEDGRIRFRYWSMPDVKHQSVSESIVQTSRSNGQFAIYSHLNSIGVPTSGELCRMPLQDFIYVRNMECTLLSPANYN